jgi:hypothetical protein
MRYIGNPAEGNVFVRWRVSKQVTNGSEIAVMDVICFLCVSLGTAQSSFKTVYVADVHAHDQRLVSVVKMATVLEECKRSFVFFCA